jgi:hypothetical protein
MVPMDTYETEIAFKKKSRRRGDYLHLQIKCQQGIPIRVKYKLNYLLGRLDISLSETRVSAEAHQ